MLEWLQDPELSWWMKATGGDSVAVRLNFDQLRAALEI